MNPKEQRRAWRQYACAALTGMVSRVDQSPQGGQCGYASAMMSDFEAIGAAASVADHMLDLERQRFDPKPKPEPEPEPKVRPKAGDRVRRNVDPELGSVGVVECLLPAAPSLHFDLGMICEVLGDDGKRHSWQWDCVDILPAGGIVPDPSTTSTDHDQAVCDCGDCENVRAAEASHRGAKEGEVEL